MNIRLLRRAICGFVLAAALCTFHSVVSHGSSPIIRQAAQAQQSKRYKIYCVEGKVTISESEPDEMKAPRGSRICLLESFDSLTEAMKAAKRYGGTRASCTCPPR
jgi:hypothetical protein